MHQKVLRVSFCLKGTTSDVDKEKLEFANLSKDQEFRVIPTLERKCTDILIPFDKIGHQEKIELLQEIDLTKMLGIKGSMPSISHKVNIAVVTNGYTKLLQLTDCQETDDEQT